MIRQIFLRQIALTLFLFYLISTRVLGQDLFISPVDTPFQLSGTYGELRANHFHSGVDFRTDGVVGKSVCSAKAGWVSRIKVSATGFGNVIYLDHPDGYTTVYGHLHRFSNQLTDYVDSAQRAVENFDVELFPDSGRFSFLQGDFIGWSGNSGSSEAPHVHFEIRDRQSQEPLNPLTFLPDPYDTLPPAFWNIALYTFNSGRYNRFAVMNLSQDSAELTPIKIETDSLFIGILANDPSPPNYLGIYSAELCLDDSLIFQFKFDRFNFNETRFVNAHTDLLDGPSGLVRLHRLYKLPGDSCSIFKESGKGLVLIQDTLMHILKLQIKDLAGNSTKLSVRVYADSLVELKDTFFLQEKVPFGKNWKKEFTNGIKMELPANALYQDEYFHLEAPFVNETGLSQLFPVLIHLNIPLHKAGKLTIPIRQIKEVPVQKVLILRKNELGKIKEVLLPDTVIPGISASCGFRNGGYFEVAMDSIPPLVTRCSYEIDPVTLQTTNVCTYAEQLSGLKTFRIEVDRQWKLAYLDSKVQKIRWENENQLPGPHLVSVSLTDHCLNTSVFEFLE